MYTSTLFRQFTEGRIVTTYIIMKNSPQILNFFCTCIMITRISNENKNAKFIIIINFFKKSKKCADTHTHDNYCNPPPTQ